MSGIAGILHLDDVPVDGRRLRRMTDAVAHRGPDGEGTWIQGSIGLGHRILRVTPQSRRESQPLADATGTLCIAFDGRIDNRDELAAALRANRALLRSDTDAELALHAYERWGEDCPAHILGDFAFAIWDGRARRLFCARDPLGMRPLCYRLEGRTFLLGSELHQLLGSDESFRPNEGMVGEYLLGAPTSLEETLHTGILRLPAAHALIAGAGGVRKSRYWDIDPAREVRCRTDREYAECFSTIFDEAVRARLRSDGPVGVLLSGGLDSSSVLMTASRAASGAPDASPAIEAFSLTFPGRPWDETRYVEAAVGAARVRSHLFESRQDGLASYAAQARTYRDLPQYPNGAMTDGIKVLARERGVRILLTGFGGDEWLTGSLYHTADLLRRLRFVKALRQLYADVRLPRRFTLAKCARLAVAPLLPPALRRAIRRILGRTETLPRWIDPDFAKRISLRDRLRAKPAAPSFRSFAQATMYAIARGGVQAHTDEIDERSTAAFGIEPRHPFNDRRLVEFALALPEDQRWRGGVTKYVLRQALGPALPAAIRTRADKAEFSGVYPEALEACGGERLFASLESAARGWIDGALLRDMYREMRSLHARGEPGYAAHLGPLWMVVAIELWLQAAGGGTTLVEPVPPPPREEVARVADP